MLSLPKEIVPAAVKESMNDLALLQEVPGNDDMFASASNITSDLVSLECAKSIPFNVASGFKHFKANQKNVSARDKVHKIRKRERDFVYKTLRLQMKLQDQHFNKERKNLRSF